MSTEPTPAPTAPSIEPIEPIDQDVPADSDADIDVSADVSADVTAAPPADLEDPSTKSSIPAQKPVRRAKKKTPTASSGKPAATATAPVFEEVRWLTVDDAAWLCVRAACSATGEIRAIQRKPQSVIRLPVAYCLSCAEQRGVPLPTSNNVRSPRHG